MVRSLPRAGEGEYPYGATAPAGCCVSGIVANGDTQPTVHQPKPALPYCRSQRTEPYFLRNDVTIAGFIVIVPYDQTECEQVLQHLYHFAKPVAVITNGTPSSITRLFPPRFPLRVFSVGVSQDAGKKVGRYCLGLGHTRIAYISPFHGSQWSVQRCEGLVSLFNKAGITNAVHASTLEYSIHDFLTLCTREFPSPFSRNWHLIQEYLLSRESSHTRIKQAIEHLFQQALSEHGCSVWVAANDLVAVLAFNYLSRHGRNVPDSLSLVSFDDSRLALRNHITSYNFNLSASARASLEFILGRPNGYYGSSSRVVSFEGMVIQRRTMRGG